METNLYTTTVLPMIKALDAVHALLGKVESHAASKQLDWHPPKMQEEALLGSRLISDQFPFVRQIQVACDNAKNGIARIAEIEAPKFEDTEKTVRELQTRVEKTIAFLKGLTPEQVIGKEAVKVSLPYWNGKSMTAFDYANSYLLPNFYFHIATAYSILRKNGVSIGKSDYMGALPLQDL